ncbi:hypothetical protein PPACK8108_LOCUS2414 [Phakopsora pachyrhizi]|uniref:Uncharacterized protein n=1 Tax=Phakopsora pachyrhizi TaxID=170000 RepID=A0AAV0AKV4_PHAPC|nr:hypothetical protein PPACK8108_LOCUS2414 [Phakopsora pachyrhizi]
METEEPPIPSTQAEELSFTTTQAAEIEAPSDSASKTLKHQLSHQSIQNPLPPPKGTLKDFRLFQKHKLGECYKQIQENEKSTDNVHVTQKKTNEQPLFRDEEQVESETHVSTEEAPITSGTQQTLPAGLRFQKKTPHQKEAPQ